MARRARHSVSEDAFLAAVRELKEGIGSLAKRIDTLENSAERRSASQTTAILFLGLPGRVIGLLASAAALVLSLAAVWALMGDWDEPRLHS